MAWLPGFMPLAAVALCAGVFLPRRLALVIPLGILLFSDAVIDAHYGAHFFSVLTLVSYVLLALIGVFGMSLHTSVPRMTRFGRCSARRWPGRCFSTLPATPWSGSARRNIRRPPPGCWQALTVGLPGYLPSYVFFRNGLVSDGLYSMVFVACVRLTLPRVERPRSSPPAVAGPDASLADARHLG